MQGTLVWRARIPPRLGRDNTVCHNTGTDILGEGGFFQQRLFPAQPGAGNVLKERSFRNGHAVTVGGWDAGEYGT